MVAVGVCCFVVIIILADIYPGAQKVCGLQWEDALSYCSILAEGAIALSVTLGGGALVFASLYSTSGIFPGLRAVTPIPFPQCYGLAI